MSYEPIAYTYDADTHCPGCAEMRFGADENGYPPAYATDREGNEVHPVFPWEEWWNVDGKCETLVCGDCLWEIDVAHADPHSPDCPEHECDFGPGEYSRFAGTYHRKCAVPGCRKVSLDVDDDDD